MRRSSDRRPFRPPDWGPTPPPHHRRPRPQPPPQFSVLLLRAAADSSTPPATEVEALVSGLPSPPPDQVSLHSSGRIAARLLFRSLAAAAAAARELWSLRLDGLHQLTPHLPNHSLASHAFPLVASLFAAHASSLLTSDPIPDAASRSSELSASIRDVNRRLSSHNRFRDFEQLRLQKKALEDEKILVDAKITEFEVAMRSIRRAMLRGTEGEEEEEEVEVEVYGIGGGEKVDFARVHMMMLRECRRLKEGLPIYAYRRRILNHIFANQVTMEFSMLIRELACGVKFDYVVVNRVKVSN